MPPIQNEHELLYLQLAQLERTARVGVLRLSAPDGPVWWSAGAADLLGLTAAVPAGWDGLTAAFGTPGVATLRAAIAAAGRIDQELDLDLPLAGERPVPVWIRICGRVSLVEGNAEANAILQDVSERRQIAAQINQATAAERQRLVMDLHDNLGQVLAGAGLLAAAHEREVRREAPALVPGARELAAALVEAQRLCRDIAHGFAEDFADGLAVALQRFAARTTQTGIVCSFRALGDDAGVLSVVQCRELFRIAQEAVTNALKHAACRRIEITLTIVPTRIELTVQDDGNGIGSAPVTEGLGLRTMRYRAARIGTTVSVLPGEGVGTRVHLSVPRV